MFPLDLVTAWMAIDEATVANGCLRMATASHRWGMVPARHALPARLHLVRRPGAADAPRPAAVRLDSRPRVPRLCVDLPPCSGGF